MFQHVLCAVDRGDTTAKVIRHAAGIAAASGGRLAVVHVTNNRPSDSLEEDLRRDFSDAVPYSASYVAAPELLVVEGGRSESILALAARWSADLIVTGTRGHGLLAGWLLGSTTRALLEATTVPVLLIPATDVDIVTLELERPYLNLGAVIAAIDVTENNARQLHVASEVAELAHLPLILLTVLASDDPSTDHEAADALRAKAHNLTPIRPHAVIVRRGEIADEIVRCCTAEDAGLVVMGLQPRSRGKRPGVIASALLALQRPAVLAVPDTAS